MGEKFQRWVRNFGVEASKRREQMENRDERERREQKK